MSTLAISLNMASFKNLCMRFSPDRAVMVRGRPGIGKSQSVWQIASALRSDTYKDMDTCRAMMVDFRGEAAIRKVIRKFWKKNEGKEQYKDYPRDIWHYDMGVPVIERRLSQLQEGDVVGIPFDGGLGTVFKPTEWLIITTKWPCILFLDELNRASKPVEQATFQIADSKAFYGHLLHEETRVYVAVNIGDAFDVSPMDPAAISRYAVIDLEPTVEDWINWAKVECNPALPDFIRSNGGWLEWDKEFEANRKVHDRRAWGNLDAELTHSGLYENPDDMTFLHMAASMVGFAAANVFWNFCKERSLDISAEEILKDWASTKTRLPKEGTDKYLAKITELSGKVSDYVKKHDLDKVQLKNCADFMRALPVEHAISVWQAASKGSRKNFTAIHPYIQDYLIKLTHGGTKNKAEVTAAKKVSK